MALVKEDGGTVLVDEDGSELFAEEIHIVNLPYGVWEVSTCESNLCGSAGASILFGFGSSCRVIMTVFDVAG